MKGKILGIIILTLLWQMNFTAPVLALQSEHPLETYERGVKILNSYHGDPSTLYEAQKCFNELITKFPVSPYGYLGLSQVQ